MPRWASTIRREVGARHVWGLLAGGLWGFLLGGGATPRARITIDQSRQVVQIVRADLPEPVTISAEIFAQIYVVNLLQVAATFLVLCFVAGWVTWQLQQARPRGQQQPSLRTGWGRYAAAFLVGGAIAVLLFQLFHLSELFVGNQPVPAVIVTGVLGLLLPLYDGVGLFLVWFRRLDSVRAPDWETHHPPPRDVARPLIGRLRRKVAASVKGGQALRSDDRLARSEAEGDRSSDEKGGNAIEESS